MPEEWDGKAPQISIPAEMSPNPSPHNLHPTHFSVGVMPWHLVECPHCQGAGNVVILRSVSRDMAIDAGEPEMEGQPIPETVTCYLCGGDSQVTEAVRKAHLALDPDGEPYLEG